MNPNDTNSFQLNELELKIISFCSAKSLGVKDLARMFNIDHAGGDMKRAITRLLQLQLIEYTIPAFHRSYSQRYRTTRKGKEYLN